MGLEWTPTQIGRWTGRDSEGREWAWVADMRSGADLDRGWDVLVTVWHPERQRLGWVGLDAASSGDAMDWADRFAVAWVDGHGSSR